MNWFDRLLCWLMCTDREHIEHTDWYLERYGRDRRWKR